MPDYKQRKLAAVETLKQIISLSSGAIILIATLMDRLGKAPYFRWTVKVALISFVCSTIFALIAMGIMGMTANDDEPWSDRFSAVIGGLIFFSPFFLLVGLVSLVVFVCNNF